MPEETKLPTVWESAQARGITRRDFIKVCTWLTAAMGLPASAHRQGRRGPGQPSPRLPVVWFHFQECTCCSESFIRSSHPIVADIILDKISLDYTETLQAAAGKQAEEALHETMKKYKGEYLMLVEGAVPAGRRRRLLLHRRPDRRSTSSQEAAAGAKAIVAWGSCASNGCIQAANPNPTGATPDPQDHLRQADHQRAGLPADRRGDGRHDRPPPGLRPHPAARRPGPAEGVLLAARPRHLLPPAELRRRPVRRVLRRRERQARLLPLQDGLPRPGHLQRLRRHALEQRRQLPDPVGPRLHRLQRGRTSGTTARSTGTCRRSRASASRPRPTRSAWSPPASRRPRHRRPRHRHQHPQAAS